MGNFQKGVICPGALWGLFCLPPLWKIRKRR